MHLDTGKLGPSKLLHIVDVVNVVVLNDTEHTAHPSDNTGLLTVMDVAAADDMASDVLLRPAVIPVSSTHLLNTGFIKNGSSYTTHKYAKYPA